MFRKFMLLTSLLLGMMWFDTSSHSAPHAMFSYAILDLGTLGGEESEAYAINDQGQVTGTAHTAKETSHAFLYSEGKMRDVSGKPVRLIEANGINSQGHIAGCYTVPQPEEFHGGLYADGNLVDLGTLGGQGSRGYGINNHDEIVGWAETRENTSHAFLCVNGTMNDLGTLPGGKYSDARAINNKGQVVGNASTAQADSHAFLYSEGVMSDLGTFSGNRRGMHSAAFGINDKGEVIGWSWTSSGGDRFAHAFLYTDHKMLDLGTLNTGTKTALINTSMAFAINNASDVVGEADTGRRGETHAFVYRNGTMYDLNQLIPAGSGWDLICARSINDKGQIIGYGRHLGSKHAFLLTPTPSL